jgi:hypothetical protein
MLRRVNSGPTRGGVYHGRMELLVFADDEDCSAHVLK